MFLISNKLLFIEFKLFSKLFSSLNNLVKNNLDNFLCFKFNFCSLFPSNFIFLFWIPKKLSEDKCFLFLFILLIYFLVQIAFIVFLNSFWLSRSTGHSSSNKENIDENLLSFFEMLLSLFIKEELFLDDSLFLFIISFDNFIIFLFLFFFVKKVFKVDYWVTLGLLNMNLFFFLYSRSFCFFIFLSLQ